jgi:hypothetical protein
MKERRRHGAASTADACVHRLPGVGLNPLAGLGGAVPLAGAFTGGGTRFGFFDSLLPLLMSIS